MAITLTARQSASYAGAAVQTITSASFTPAANSKLYMAVYIVASGGDGSLFDIVHTSNTGSLTFTRVAQSTHSGGGNGAKMALFEATVGGSPSAMTVTFDVDSDGIETAYPWIGAFDAVGSSGTVSIKSGQITTKVELDGGTNTETHASGTLPVATTSGNTSILILGRNNDAAGAPTTPIGWTALFAPAGDYISGAVWSRTDFASAGPVSITDLGELVQTSATVLLELQEASSGGANVIAVKATATASAPIPVVSGSSAGATVTAVKASATGTAPVPVVSGESVVTGGGPATATAIMLAPAVTATGSGSVAAVAATATGLALIPSVGGAVGATVSAPRATALVIPNAPSITAVRNVTAVALKASATGTARAPQVVAIAPTFLFIPPTHEEPIRTNVRPLDRYRLTHAASVVRVGGVLTSVRRPNQNLLRDAGEEGVDWFLGGREYVVTQAVATELQSAGYSIGG